MTCSIACPTGNCRFAVQRLAFNACGIGGNPPPCRCTVSQTIATAKQLDFGIFIWFTRSICDHARPALFIRSPGLAKDWSRRLELEAVVGIKPSQKNAQTFVSTVVKVKKSWWYKTCTSHPARQPRKIAHGLRMLW